MVRPNRLEGARANVTGEKRIAERVDLTFALDNAGFDNHPERRMDGRRHAQPVTSAIALDKFRHRLRGERRNQGTLRGRKGAEALGKIVGVIRQQRVDGLVEVPRLEPILLVRNDGIEREVPELLDVIGDVPLKRATIYQITYKKSTISLCKST